MGNSDKQAKISLFAYRFFCCHWAPGFHKWTVFSTTNTGGERNALTHLSEKEQHWEDWISNSVAAIPRSFFSPRGTNTGFVINAPSCKVWLFYLAGKVHWVYIQAQWGRLSMRSFALVLQLLSRFHFSSSCAVLEGIGMTYFTFRYKSLCFNGQQSGRRELTKTTRPAKQCAARHAGRYWHCYKAGTEAIASCRSPRSPNFEVNLWREVELMLQTAAAADDACTQLTGPCGKHLFCARNILFKSARLSHHHSVFARV